VGCGGAGVWVGFWGRRRRALEARSSLVPVRCQSKQHWPCVRLRSRMREPPYGPTHPQMNYQNKEMLMGAMIVAGYDAQRGGQVRVEKGHGSVHRGWPAGRGPVAARPVLAVGTARGSCRQWCRTRPSHEQDEAGQERGRTGTPLSLRRAPCMLPWQGWTRPAAPAPESPAAGPDIASCTLFVACSFLPGLWLSHRRVPGGGEVGGGRQRLYIHLGSPG
jgi:hypothetical protein